MGSGVAYPLHLSLPEEAIHGILGDTELSADNPMLLPALIADTAMTHGCTSLNAAIAVLGDTLLGQGASSNPYEIREVLADGVYVRTALIPAGELWVGNLLQVPTTLLLHGDCTLRVHDSIQRLRGFNVVVEPAGIMRIGIAHTECQFTTVNRTSAKSIEAARAEFMGQSKEQSKA